MKSNILLILVLAAGVSGSAACSKMNDLHESYLKEGEKVYAAKIDSAKGFVGVNTQVIYLYIPSRRAERIVIKWNLGADSLAFTLRKGDVSPLRVNVPDLEEGNYTYEIYTYDAFGNCSLAYELTSNVVSEETMSNHKEVMSKSVYYTEYDKCMAELARRYAPAKIINAQNFGGSAWFMWDNDALPGAKVYLRYKTRTGEWNTKVYPGEELVRNQWDNSLTDALVEPRDTQPFYYTTVYEDIGYKYHFSTAIDLGEEYADRYFDYEDEIVVETYSLPEVKDIW